jgi:hypothetical protein
MMLVAYEIAQLALLHHHTLLLMQVVVRLL